MADTQEIEINHHTRASEIVSIFRALSSGPNQHIASAWANMLDVEISSDEYYTTLGAISRNLASLHDEIELSPLRDASKKMYLGAVAAFQQYVEVTKIKGSTTDQLKAETDSFRLLTLLDDVLKPNASRDMPKATLKAWLATIDELILSADEALSDPTLNAFVIRQLHHLRWAVGNYRFIGIDGVSRAYGSMTAEIARSQNMKGGQTDGARSWYQKAKRPIVALGAAIAASSAVVEQVDNLVEHGGSIYEAVTDQTGTVPTDGKAVSEKE